MKTQAITIRKGYKEDLPVLQQLFANTVAAVNNEDYNEEQVDAWITAGLNNQLKWQRMIAEAYLLVAQEEEKITGFCSLAKNGHLDFLYVDKDFQGKGIAAALFNSIEKIAIERGDIHLTADVSKTTRYFFEKIGFNMLSEQTIIRQGIELSNFKMQKELSVNVRNIRRFDRPA